MKMENNLAEIENLPLPDPLPSTGKGGKDAPALHELIICPLLPHLPTINDHNPVAHHHHLKLMRGHYLPNHIKNPGLVFFIQR